MAKRFVLTENEKKHIRKLNLIEENCCQSASKKADTHALDTTKHILECDRSTNYT